MVLGMWAKVEGTAFGLGIACFVFSCFIRFFAFVLHVLHLRNVALLSHFCFMLLHF